MDRTPQRNRPETTYFVAYFAEMSSATVAATTRVSASAEGRPVGPAITDPTAPKPTRSPATAVARPGRAVVGSGADTRGTVQPLSEGHQLLQDSLAVADEHGRPPMDRLGERTAKGTH